MKAKISTKGMNVNFGNNAMQTNFSNIQRVAVGPTDYEELENKPQINDVTLIGNKSLDDLDIQPKGNYANSKITNSELEEIFKDW